MNLLVEFGWKRIFSIFQGTYEEKIRIECDFIPRDFIPREKDAIENGSNDLITFQLDTSNDIVPDLLELLLEASEQQGGS